MMGKRCIFILINLSPQFHILFIRTVSNNSNRTTVLLAEPMTLSLKEAIDVFMAHYRCGTDPGVSFTLITTSSTVVIKPVAVSCYLM